MLDLTQQLEAALSTCNSNQEIAEQRFSSLTASAGPLFTGYSRPLSTQQSDGVHSNYLRLLVTLQSGAGLQRVPQRTRETGVEIGTHEGGQTPRRLYYYTRYTRIVRDGKLIKAPAAASHARRRIIDVPDSHGPLQPVVAVSHDKLVRAELSELLRITRAAVVWPDHDNRFHNNTDPLDDRDHYVARGTGQWGKAPSEVGFIRHINWWE